MAKHTHLSEDERKLICNLLDQKCSFKEIGRKLNRDCTTISKEVRTHRLPQKKGAYHKSFNNCANRSTCRKITLCHDNMCMSTKLCKYCPECTYVCKDFVEEKCEKLNKPPYVCNGCSKANTCTLEKMYYKPGKAHDQYRATLSESRSGISLSEREVAEIDAFITPLIKQKQSIHHICHNNKDVLPVSESTIYRLIDYGVIEARNIDLPRKVRFSKRHVKVHVKVDRKCRINRTYEDFKSFRAENPDTPITEIDSVEGVKGGKVLLTIHFVNTECMLAFIREHNNSQSVIDVFNMLYEKLGDKDFRALMPVLLGDNGTEFSNPNAIETAPDGSIRTRVFYCHASAPYEKGSAERNHEFVRYFVPKGKSFDDLTQDDVNLMMNNINSYSRKSLGNKTPYEMMEFLYGHDVVEKLGMRKIEPNKVTLSSSIFKKTDTE